MHRHATPARRGAAPSPWLACAVALVALAACSDGDAAAAATDGGMAPCDPAGPRDRDEDGHDEICLDRGLPRGDDCDDGDPLRFPGNEEVCDQQARDEDCDPTTVGDRDRDGDGHGDARCCNGTGHERRCGDDCHDLRAEVRPGAPEACDHFDNDCDGDIDEDTPHVTRYPDVDHDDHAATDAKGVRVCEADLGFVAKRDDCDDADSERHPGLPEFCDERDNDCDRKPEAPGEGRDIVWYTDGDADGFGSERLTAISCIPPPFPILCNEDIAPNTCFISKPAVPLPGKMSQHHVDGVIPFVAGAGDCDDNDNSNFPGAVERCDAVDNDCNGRADYPLGVNDFEDDDGDLRIDAQCNPDADCDDMDVTIGPDRDEVCDRFDNDCDGKVDEGVATGPWYPDRDEDGYGDDAADGIDSCAWVPGRAATAGDCDDTDRERHVGARERCNALDDDCDGVVDEVVSACGKLGALAGTVTDRAHREPVAHAELRVFDAHGNALATRETDADGTFSLDLPAAAYTVVVRPPAGAYLVGLVRAVEVPQDGVTLVLDRPDRWRDFAASLGSSWNRDLGLVVLQVDGVSPSGDQGALIAPESGRTIARVGAATSSGGILPPFAPPLAAPAGAPFAEIAFLDVTPGLHAIPISDLARHNGFDVPNCMTVDVPDVGDSAPATGKRVILHAWPVVEGAVTLLRVDCSLGLGNCCAAHGGAGCSEPDIVRCVCDADPNCCATDGWNADCARGVTARGCSSCPAVTPDGGACCTPGDFFGCGAPEIEACVCRTKPECCVGTWAAECAGSVHPLRCGICEAPDGGAPGAGTP